MAIRGGKVQFVGSTNRAVALRGGSTHVVDLGGRTVIDQDIMRVAPELVLKTQVLATYVGGKAVYERRAVVP